MTNPPIEAKIYSIGRFKVIAFWFGLEQATCKTCMVWEECTSKDLVLCMINCIDVTLLVVKSLKVLENISVAHICRIRSGQLADNTGEHILVAKQHVCTCTWLYAFLKSEKPINNYCTVFVSKCWICAYLWFEAILHGSWVKTHFY